MIVRKISFDDVFAANCYFYIDEKSGHGFVIDPSAHSEVLLSLAENNKWTIEKILLTHTHLDHIGAVLELSKEWKVPFFASLKAQEYLKRQELAAHFTDRDVLSGISPLGDGDNIVLSTNASEMLQVLETPGHTLDSVIYYAKKDGLAFTGDTIFCAGIGRTDIEGSAGDYKTLIKSITQKVFSLPPNTVLYPGHGPATTVARELQHF